MGNGLQVFSYEGKEVRTIVRDGETWWTLCDVCTALDITNSRDVAKRLDDDEKGVDSIDTLGGMQELTVIRESGLYKVILRSDKPAAKPFLNWVTRDVLPSIRKHGMYATDELLDDPDLLLAVIQKLKAERDQRLLAESQRNALQTRLDEAEEWYSVKRWANENATDWKFVGDPTGRGQGWRKLKTISQALGLDIRKCFDANYGNVNTYNKKAFDLL